ncbi:glycosyltransferase family 4 protein [Microvirga sp. TS319]|uniref:glycosyltransferase family 4 protein n=1 Tax=Microvirga sp. TS319 TaxID=3241165 RepID=UPI003519DB35
MRILVFTPLGRGGEGGVDRMMDGLHDELARQGLEDVCVNFIATRGRTTLWPLRYILCLVRALLLGLGRTYDVWHINLGSFGSTVRKLILVLIARSTGQAYVVHLHGGHFREYWESRPKFYRDMIRSMFLHASAVVVLGAIWKDLILEHVPECADRIVVLPNATRAPQYRQKCPSRDERVRILFLGRLGPEKGTPELLEALSDLSRLPEWDCALAGDGMVQETRALADAKLPGRVSVLGWVDSAEVERLLNASDVLVLPSHVENLPMSVVEAFAHGLAVAATPVGSIPDILEHEENGLLVPVRDATALAAALERLIVDRSLRERLGRNAKVTYQRSLTIESYVDRLLGIWKDAAPTSRAAEMS